MYVIIFKDDGSEADPIAVSDTAVKAIKYARRIIKDFEKTGFELTLEDKPCKDFCKFVMENPNHPGHPVYIKIVKRELV